jgi:hypothetical protein
MKNQAIMLSNVCMFSITIVMLASLAGCTQAEKALIIKAVTPSPEL